MQDTVKRQLAAELEALHERMARLERRKANATRDDAHSIDDDAQQHQDDEVIDSLDDRSRARVAEIVRTLRRIDEGTWATCDRCERPIDAARLRALPTTELCTACSREAVT
jgi:RNA polymerase-binding transcription factor DksA